jgi:hypothetical protein
MTQNFKKISNLSSLLFKASVLTVHIYKIKNKTKQKSSHGSPNLYKI